MAGNDIFGNCSFDIPGQRLSVMQRKKKKLQYTVRVFKISKKTWNACCNHRAILFDPTGLCI